MLIGSTLTCLLCHIVDAIALQRKHNLDNTLLASIENCLGLLLAYSRQKTLGLTQEFVLLGILTARVNSVLNNEYLIQGKGQLDYLIIQTTISTVSPMTSTTGLSHPQLLEAVVIGTLRRYSITIRPGRPKEHS